MGKLALPPKGDEHIAVRFSRAAVRPAGFYRRLIDKLIDRLFARFDGKEFEG